jgi:hypothetical protein
MTDKSGPHLKKSFGHAALNRYAAVGLYPPLTRSIMLTFATNFLSKPFIDKYETQTRATQPPSSWQISHGVLTVRDICELEELATPVLENAFSC